VPKWVRLGAEPRVKAACPLDHVLRILGSQGWASALGLATQRPTLPFLAHQSSKMFEGLGWGYQRALPTSSTKQEWLTACDVMDVARSRQQIALGSKAGYMAAPERFAEASDSFSLAPRAPSLHGNSFT